MISYLHITSSKTGILIIGLNIPRSPSTYRDFAAAMSLTEAGLLKALQGNI